MFYKSEKCLQRHVKERVQVHCIFIEIIYERKAVYFGTEYRTGPAICAE